MSDNVREAVDWNSIAADAARFGRGGASIVAKRAREREAELLAALAAPSSESPAATGSGAAPTRDDVAEVLLREANRDLTGWTWAQLCESRIAGIVVVVALARRQADAILSRWSAPPAPRGEAVAWMKRPDAPGYWWHRFTNDAKAGRKPVLIQVVEIEAAHFRSERGGLVSPPCPFVDGEEWRQVPSPDSPVRVVALVPQHEDP